MPKEHRTHRRLAETRSSEAAYPFRRSSGEAIDPESYPEYTESTRYLPVTQSQIQQQPATHQLRQSRWVKSKARGIVWAYGVTTVPSRLNTTLPQTLKSLYLAGFEDPRLFIDGATEQDAQQYVKFGLDYTSRYPHIRTTGNWILSLWELHIRNPAATRFAMFQDDFLTYRNLREFLERQPYPDKGYWNLYSFSTNEPLLKADNQGWLKAGRVSGHPDLQTGRGAVALVFDRDAMLALLSSPSLVQKPLDQHRGWRTIDGAVVNAMNKAGWTEYIHNPSLVQHIGYPSTIAGIRHKQAETFRGHDFDALELLK